MPSKKDIGTIAFKTTAPIPARHYSQPLFTKHCDRATRILLRTAMPVRVEFSSSGSGSARPMTTPSSMVQTLRDRADTRIVRASRTL